ncbi:hypothetical protein SAVIM40S_07807 [Streptomyces avidinii]
MASIARSGFVAGSRLTVRPRVRAPRPPCPGRGGLPDRTRVRVRRAVGRRCRMNRAQVRRSGPAGIQWPRARLSSALSTFDFYGSARRAVDARRRTCSSRRARRASCTVDRPMSTHRCRQRPWRGAPRGPRARLRGGPGGPATGSEPPRPGSWPAGSRRAVPPAARTYEPPPSVTGRRHVGSLPGRGGAGVVRGVTTRLRKDSRGARSGTCGTPVPVARAGSGISVGRPRFARPEPWDGGRDGPAWFRRIEASAPQPAVRAPPRGLHAPDMCTAPAVHPDEALAGLLFKAAAPWAVSSGSCRARDARHRTRPRCRGARVRPLQGRLSALPDTAPDAAGSADKIRKRRPRWGSPVTSCLTRIQFLGAYAVLTPCPGPRRPSNWACGRCSRCR